MIRLSLPIRFRSRIATTAPSRTQRARRAVGVALARPGYEMLLKGFARASGYPDADVQFALDGGSCLLQLSEGAAHLVVLDTQGLGTQTGLWSERIRATPGHGTLPILLIQGPTAIEGPPTLTASVRKGALPEDFLRGLNALLRG